MKRFAIDFVLGNKTGTIVVLAADSDQAFDLFRKVLKQEGLVSAALQGNARAASKSDIERAEFRPAKRSKKTTGVWQFRVNPDGSVSHDDQCAIGLIEDRLGVGSFEIADRYLSITPDMGWRFVLVCEKHAKVIRPILDGFDIGRRCSGSVILR